MRRLTARAASICAATAVAGAVTAANRAGWLDISHLAATPRAVAEGELWRLLTSGVIADRPWLPSLLGCAFIGFAFRPDVNALDSEHLVAFALGFAIAAWWSGPAAPAAPRGHDLDRELQELLRAS